MSDNNQIPQNPMEHEVPTLDNPGNEVPPQPIQFTQPDYEQPTFSQPQFNQPQFEQPNAPKKGKKKLAGLIAAVVGVVACACVAVFAGPKIIAALSNSAKGAPIDRFKNAITEASKEAAEDFTKKTPMNSLTGEKVQADVTFDVTMGEYLTAMLPAEYANIKNIGGSMQVVSVDKNQYVNLALSSQSTQLASMEVYVDQLANMAFIKVPELSPDYLSASLDSETFNISSTVNQETVDPAKLATLLTDETDIFLSSINEVTLEDDVAVDASDVSAEYDKLTTTIQGEKLVTAAYDITKRFVEDQTISSLLNDALSAQGLSTDSILTSIQSAQLSDTDKVTIDLYLDSDDEIVGLVLTPQTTEGKAEIGFLSAEDGKTGFEIYATVNDEKVLKIDGSYTEKSDAYTGKATLAVYEAGIASANVDLTFEDVISNENKFAGKFSVTSAQLMGATINCDVNCENQHMTLKLDVLMAASPLISATFDATMSEASTCPTVPTDAVIYDAETQVTDYMTNADLMGFLQKIQDATGIDLTSLMYGY